MRPILPLQSLIAATALLVALAFAMPEQACAASDWGDNTSMVLTGKAWDAFAANKLDDTLDYANRCIDTYSTQAKQMQAALSTRPANEPKETTSSRWALNDCATCLFIKGEVAIKKGDKDAAKLAYGQLVKDFKDGMCWDPKGWFWCPADAAKTKLVELEFEAK